MKKAYNRKRKKVYRLTAILFWALQSRLSEFGLHARPFYVKRDDPWSQLFFGPVILKRKYSLSESIQCEKSREKGEGRKKSKAAYTYSFS